MLNNADRQIDLGFNNKNKMIKLDDENPDEETEYRVRGGSKNGLCLKKIKMLKPKNLRPVAAPPLQ